MKQINGFEKVLNIIKTIRRMKANADIPTSVVDNCRLYLRNNEDDLWMVIKSFKSICNLSKCKSLFVIYLDEQIPANGMILYYDVTTDKSYVSEFIPYGNFENIPTSSLLQQVYDKNFVEFCL